MIVLSPQRSDCLNSAMRMDEADCFGDMEDEIVGGPQSLNMCGGRFILDVEDPNSLFIQPIWTTEQPKIEGDSFMEDEEEEEECCEVMHSVLEEDEPSMIMPDYEFSQCGPFYAMQEVDEEDPNYLLKLMHLEPPKSYIPTFL